MKTQWKNRGKVPRILNLDARRRWVFSFTHQSLYSRRKSPQLGGLSNQQNDYGDK